MKKMIESWYDELIFENFEWPVFEKGFVQIAGRYLCKIIDPWHQNAEVWIGLGLK